MPVLLTYERKQEIKDNLKKKYETERQKLLLTLPENARGIKGASFEKIIKATIENIIKDNSDTKYTIKRGSSDRIIGTNLLGQKNPFATDIHVRYNKDLLGLEAKTYFEACMANKAVRDCQEMKKSLQIEGKLCFFVVAIQNAMSKKGKYPPRDEYNCGVKNGFDGVFYLSKIPRKTRDGKCINTLEIDNLLDDSLIIKFIEAVAEAL